MTPTALRISRRFNASPEQLFDAWLDPKVVARWLFTSPASEAHTVEIDRQVDGEWVITDRRDGVDYTALGEYLEIKRPHRLVFSFGMPQFSDQSATVTVEIAPDGDGSVLTLTQSDLPVAHHEPTRQGWEAMFDMLDGVLAPR